MGPRPPRLHLAASSSPSESSKPPFITLPSPHLPSPRAGEIPPALSPLDAFALQSRILAKHFDQAATGGKRLSRLPATTVAKSLASRPEFFRCPSEAETTVEDASPVEPQQPLLSQRPLSQYPMLGQIAQDDADNATAELQDEYLATNTNESPKPSDPDAQSSMPTLSTNRTFSGSSGKAQPTSPFLPESRSMCRSPSLVSVSSVGPAQFHASPSISRPGSKNFSQPIAFAKKPSSLGRASGKEAIRQFSGDSLPPSGAHAELLPLSRANSDLSAHTPFASERWETPGLQPTPTDYFCPQPDPITRPITSSSMQPNLPRPLLTDLRLWPPRQRQGSGGSPSSPASAVSEQTPRGRPPLTPVQSNRSVSSRSAGSEGRCTGLRRPLAASERPPISTPGSASQMAPEQHLETGIQAHAAGALGKSAYHLRFAAQAGLPTAMLLYALACRHGWGTRANAEEGVKWLRKALEDIRTPDSDETDFPSPDPDPARRAQFALALYELGISYMNGWGCSKDRALALRCYEVAGRWGDCDALTEAAYCYSQGIGCKKDLKKSAALYRQAATGGVHVAGNSWYALHHVSVRLH
ncbi:HCP-like protein [Piedraia hortae CBS 480.64]|uniref:HCP-like protein n=1 Tax=Piedraia hortae CBS 480.64 TaxID=1314780 RepID=A0A6A7BTX8_9PEZI|nr:HCP-like protein [Piedraia hortae CBS 480.64]